MWYKKYRLLLVIYGMCLIVGVREYLITRGEEPPGWFTEEGRQLTDFLEGMQALAAGDVEAYERRLEEALAREPKHNDMMLRFYAQHLIDTGADWVRVNQALNNWRINHPFDVETIAYDLDRGPTTQLELTALQDALERIRWIDQVWLEPFGGETEAVRWRITIAFRNAAVVDIRDVTRAVDLILPN